MALQALQVLAILHGGGEDLLTDIFPFLSVVLDLLWMCRAEPELDTVRAVADAPEEVSAVSVDVDEAVQTFNSTDLALISEQPGPQLAGH